MDEAQEALSEIKAHQRECAVRYENIEKRLNEGSEKFKKLEMMIWGVYPFMVATIVAAKYLWMKGTILAFMLVTVIEGNVAQGSDQMLFRDIHRCQQFAYWIEHNCRDVRCRGGVKQHNITAYCKPVMAGANQKFWDWRWASIAVYFISMRKNGLLDGTSTLSFIDSNG